MPARELPGDLVREWELQRRVPAVPDPLIATLQQVQTAAVRGETFLIRNADGTVCLEIEA